MKYLALWTVAFVVITIFGIRDISHLTDHTIRGYVAGAMVGMGIVGMLICGFLRQKQAEAATSPSGKPPIKVTEIVILVAIVAIIGGVMALLFSLR